jgi:hypothetical protein
LDYGHDISSFDLVKFQIVSAAGVFLFTLAIRKKAVKNKKNDFSIHDVGPVFRSDFL